MKRLRLQTNSIVGKINPIRFFRGHAPRKKHFSAQKCASVFRRECARWAASPLSAKPFGFVDSLRRL